ncbi:tartrate-resistant acid phosphatase type 5 family protein [Hyphomicrobium sp. CS1GBMeth3]|uniref:purple acid phosphatase family protein n=1 Tax=Hyphomicrobium sp. CS1GBMeth3 TaxID=1892845 RepID=UPI00093172EE|nr:tartrate-resistant acid phosphatase type 5 family protein [Hyphomicrobium sp. CS1GBMeth3]
MNPISRRTILKSGLGTAALLAHAHLGYAQETRDGLRFLAIGDWGERTPGQKPVATALAEASRRLDPEFIVSTGDNIYENGVKSVDDPLWVDVFEKIYDDPNLMRPWYAVLGNHDHRGNVDAQIAYSGVSGRWTMPSRYYKRSKTLGDGRLLDFFFLDTTELTKDDSELVEFLKGRDTDDQLKWLKKSLSESRAHWKIVIGHHPVFSGGPHEHYTVFEKRLRPLLERYGVEAYINGHDHNLQHIKVGNVHYLTSGGGAHADQPRPTPHTLFQAGTTGFLAVSLVPDEMSFEFIGSDGQTLYRSELPVRA